MHFNRNYAKHTALECMYYNIGDQLGQRRGITMRKENVNMLSWKSVLVGCLNRPVRLCFWPK